VDSSPGRIANALLSGRIAEKCKPVYKERKIIPAQLKEYEERFFKEKGRELKFYSYCRAIFLKMTDEDLDDAVSFLKEYFGERTVTGLQPISWLRRY